jgi:hypothetical protein
MLSPNAVDECPVFPRSDKGELGADLNSESFGSFAPARFGLSDCPSMSLASPRLHSRAGHLTFHSLDLDPFSSCAGPADIRDSRISPLARTFATATGARIARPADYTLQLSQRQVRGHSPALLPFLKCSLRDFEFQSCLALGKIAPRAPAVESLAQAIPDPASIMIRLGPFSTTHPALPPGEMPDTKQ